MKTMKKLWMAASVAAISMTGCQEEQFEGRPDPDNYYASVETFGTDTRTALGEGRSVVWSSEDRIAIFEGNGSGQAYQVLDAYVGKSSGEFAEVEGLMTEETGAGIEGTIAVYPFNEDLTVTSGDNGNYIIEGITFPSDQKYIAGSFSDEAFPMTAICEQGNKSLSFKNIGGVLKLSLTGSYSVSQITLTGNSGEPLSGPATVILGSDGIPSVTMSDDASTSVSLFCDPAVQLDPQKATDFYISIPPTKFEAGFKVTILDEEGKEHGLATHRSNSVERSAILAMPETTPESLDGIELTADTFCSVDFIEGWTETRFGGDGTIVFIKKDDMGRMTHSLMLLPNDETGLMPVFVRFDEKEIPSYMSFMDTEIYIDGYTENTIDFTLAVEEAVWSIKDVPFDELKFFSPATKAWTDNNWVRNVCAIGFLIVGSMDVAGGTILIAGSGIAGIGSGGSLAPISVFGIAAGGVNISAGCKTISDGYKTIFGAPEEQKSSYVKQMIIDVSLEGFSKALTSAPKNQFLKTHLPAIIMKETIESGKIGVASFIIGMGLTTIDALWGETYGKYRSLSQAHQNISILTGKSENITPFSAEIFGYIDPYATCPLGEMVEFRIGFVFWEDTETSEKYYYFANDTNGGSFSYTVENLLPGHNYKYRAIFYDDTNGIGRYGNIESFTTMEENVLWIDLGLSVLWAAYNVGASSQGEYGEYYAWGEIETKSEYKFENYKHRERNPDYVHNCMGDDCSCWGYKFIGDEISGTSYDVAHVKWGGGARMPTSAEAEELMQNCTFIYGTYNGIEGDYIKGPNGHYIFLPFPGLKDGNVHYYKGEVGHYWTGTYYGNGGWNVHCAHFFTCSSGTDGMAGDWRTRGRSVRPVKDK